MFKAGRQYFRQTLKSALLAISRIVDSMLFKAFSVKKSLNCFLFAAKNCCSNFIKKVLLLLSRSNYLSGVSSSATKVLTFIYLGIRVYRQPFTYTYRHPLTYTYRHALTYTYWQPFTQTFGHPFTYIYSHPFTYTYRHLFTYRIMLGLSGDQKYPS